MRVSQSPPPPLSIPVSPILHLLPPDILTSAIQRPILQTENGVYMPHLRVKKGDQIPLLPGRAWQNDYWFTVHLERSSRWNSNVSRFRILFLYYQNLKGIESRTAYLPLNVAQTFWTPFFSTTLSQLQKNGVVPWRLPIFVQTTHLALKRVDYSCLWLKISQNCRFSSYSKTIKTSVSK